MSSDTDVKLKLIAMMAENLSRKNAWPDEVTSKCIEIKHLCDEIIQDQRSHYGGAR